MRADRFILVAVILVAIGLIWLLTRDINGSGSRGQGEIVAYPAEQDRPKDPSRDPDPAPDLDTAPGTDVQKHRRPELPPLDGPTPFVRRLNLNPYVWGAKGPEELNALSEHFVAADRFDERWPWKASVSRLYLYTLPKQVSGGNHLRFWTLDGRYHEYDRTEGERLVDLWLSVARGRLPHRIDVLATPRMGAEVFRGFKNARAAGTYFLDDRFIVVRTKSPPRYRRRTLKHELAHAVTFYLNERFTDSRLVGEGLAKYLALGRKGDRDIGFPLARMGPLLALLNRYLSHWEAYGFVFPNDTLARWVDAPPWVFYRYGRIGYLLGVAAIAYLGRYDVERALRRRSASGLEWSIRYVRWEKFRAFVRRGGLKADPQKALLILDGVGKRPPGGRLAVHLAQLGTPPMLPDDLSGPAAEDLFADFLTPSEDPILFLVDPSPRMDVDRGGWTGRGWAKHLHGLLQTAAPVEMRGHFEPPERARVGELRSWGATVLDLIRDRSKIRIVVCAADASPVSRRLLAARHKTFSRKRAARILVVDLGPGRSFFALNLAWVKGAAYWRPTELPARPR